VQQAQVVATDPLRGEDVGALRANQLVGGADEERERSLAEQCVVRGVHEEVLSGAEARMYVI
jgi:hypothetical protein